MAEPGRGGRFCVKFGNDPKVGPLHTPAHSSLLIPAHAHAPDSLRESRDDHQGMGPGVEPLLTSERKVAWW